jgi:hypothetical protein
VSILLFGARRVDGGIVARPGQISPHPGRPLTRVIPLGRERPGRFVTDARGTISRMEWWIILLIILGALIVAGIIIVGGRRAGERRLESKRAEATELREEARVQQRRADERLSIAEEQAEQARTERAEAEERARQADDVDPDIDADNDNRR